MSIGDNIRQLRISHGMSQQELADIAGVSDGSVSNWENNTKIPRMGPIQRIADYFGVKKSNIIEEDGLSPMRMHSSKMIPVYDKYSIGIPEKENTPIDCIDVDVKVLGSNDAIAFKIQDERLSPHFLNGDIVVFLKSNRKSTFDWLFDNESMLEHDLFLFSLNNSEAKPGYLSLVNNETVAAFHSANINNHNMVLVDKKNGIFDGLAIIGKAIEIRRNLRWY